jgi:hypothetical protein
VTVGDVPRALLAIIELGGYPDFRPLYEKAGYAPAVISTVRKAIAEIRRAPPEVIVCEFNFQSDFRDRTSTLESLLAVVSRHAGTRVIVFYDREHAHHLDKLRARFPLHAALPYPIDTEALYRALTTGT